MPTLQELLTQVYGQTDRLRRATVNTLSDVMGGAPASTLPAYAPNRAAIEGQYNVAAEQARSIIPRGGQLNRALLDLGRSRAGAVSGLESSVRGDALNKAMSLGFGVVPGIISGTAGAETTALTGQRLGLETDIAQQQAKNQLVGNIGMGLGLLGTILGGFWR